MKILIKKTALILFYILIIVQSAYPQAVFIDQDDLDEIIEKYDLDELTDKNDLNKIFDKDVFDEIINIYNFDSSIKRNDFIDWILIELTSVRIIDIRVDGGWTDLSIGSEDLIGGAGTDLIDTYTSNTDASHIDIRRARKNDYWRIDIRRSDINWFEDLNLYARRTGGGSGNGSASGGLSFVEINSIDREFFSGRGLLNNIPMQYQLSGVSLQVPPDTYSTTVIFTIVQM